jgi:hypothetical protein
MTNACRCKCGETIWREYRWNGLILAPRYFSPEVLQSVGKTDPYRITHCPGCGEQLREDALLAADED